MPKLSRDFASWLTVAMLSPALSFCATPASAVQLVDSNSAAFTAAVPRLKVQDFGHMKPSASIDIEVALPYNHEAELEAFIRATSDPSSPEYGHFLTSQQFAATFSPTLANYYRVAQTLARAGFTITPGTSNRVFIHASAPTTVVESFFGTELHNVRQSGVPGVRYANATPGHLPAALRGLTVGFTGLNNLVVAKTHHVRAAAAPVRAAALFDHPLFGPDGGYSPFVLEKAYDFPVLHQRPGASPGRTFDGSGRSIGIAIDADIEEREILTFLSYFKIKRSGPPLARVKVDGGASFNSDKAETALDAEQTLSLAPGSAVSLYLFPDLSNQHILDAYDRVVADNKVDVLSSSFGGCETAPDGTFSRLADHIAQQANALGITFLASSGDDGADGCPQLDNEIGVSSPASAPHFTAVGGTDLLIDYTATYLKEFGWAGSGGGVSTVFKVPPYQQGIAHIIRSGRNVPDISFDADPGTGPAWYVYDFWYGPIGGTSVSSPLYSAMLAENDEQSGKRAGDVNYALYGEYAKNQYRTRFRDVTLGNNNLYNATPGYDNVTGIGSATGEPHGK